jgi:hypothetical protein
MGIIRNSTMLGVGIIRNTTLLGIMTIVALLFVPFAVFVPRQPAFEVLNAICIAAAAGAAMGWAKSTWDALRLPPRLMTAGHIVIVSVFLICTASVGFFLAQWAWRVMDRPDWILDSAATLFSRWVFAGALILAMTANWSTDGVITVGAYKRTLALVATAVLIASVLMGLGFS